MQKVKTEEERERLEERKRKQERIAKEAQERAEELQRQVAEIGSGTGGIDVPGDVNPSGNLEPGSK